MAGNSYGSTFWNLVQATRSGNVVAFVGAGVSNAVRGTPTWRECIRGLIGAVPTPGTRYFADILKELERIAEEDSLFVAEQCRKYLQDQFPEVVERILSVSGQGEEDAKRGVETLIRLPFYRIVTTNYDDLLLDVVRKCQPDRIVERFTHRDTAYFGEFLRDGDSKTRRSLFHVHGRLGDPDSVILTEGQYQEIYSKPEFVQLMETIFATKSALFIGFSLNDLDVMQIFRRIIAQFPRSRESHFAILPRDPKKSSSASWLDVLRHNYKYSVGILYYEPENHSHRGLWKIVEDLYQEIEVEKRWLREPLGKIAVLVDEGFPQERNLCDIVDFLNRIQHEIKYDICRDIRIRLPERFNGSHRPLDAVFDPIRNFRDTNKKKFDGIFVVTNKQEGSQYFFCDWQFGGFISTWFWAENVTRRPSIDEFISHALVLLTLHFYDHWISKPKVLQTHQTDTGCLFDFTWRLKKRIFLIDYPRICPECRQQLYNAFQGREIGLGIDWLRKVMPLVEENAPA